MKNFRNEMLDAAVSMLKKYEKSYGKENAKYFIGADRFVEYPDVMDTIEHAISDCQTVHRVLGDSEALADTALIGIAYNYSALEAGYNEESGLIEFSQVPTNGSVYQNLRHLIEDLEKLGYCFD